MKKITKKEKCLEIFKYLKITNEIYVLSLLIEGNILYFLLSENYYINLDILQYVHISKHIVHTYRVFVVLGIESGAFALSYVSSPLFKKNYWHMFVIHNDVTS